MIHRRRFLQQAPCAALGSSALLNTLLNLKLANCLAAQPAGRESKALVALFLHGGVDSFNLLVPREPAAYRTYANSRGGFDIDGGVALPRESLLPLDPPNADFGLHPACPGLQSMANGTGQFAGRRRLAFVANIGTLVQPVTKAQYRAWESGDDRKLPMPRALFSHSDQVDQWQTAVPQGMDQLSGWAGRCADILHARYNDPGTMMSISLGGNNLLQTGNRVQQFSVDLQGAVSFAGDSISDRNHPLSLKNSGLRGTLNQEYANLLTEAFSRITRESDEAQRFFQAQFESTAAVLPPGVEAMFSSGSGLALTLKAVLKTILIRGRLGVRRQTFFVQAGGWDHHSDLLNAQAPMLATLDTALTGFQQAVEALGLARDVVTFTCSDFGRTLRSNGRGTDHAWGGNMMVLGGAVNGGRMAGRYPDLALEGPDDVGFGGRMLPGTSVDQLFAELLRWFGVPASEMSYVLPNIRNFWDPASNISPLGLLGP